LKISQLLEKIELQEKEEKKKIGKKVDNQFYTKLLSHFYRVKPSFSLLKT